MLEVGILDLFQVSNFCSQNDDSNHKNEAHCKFWAYYTKNKFNPTVERMNSILHNCLLL